MGQLSFLLLFGSAALSLPAFAALIPPNDPKIGWTGAAFAKAGPDLVEFCRFSGACLADPEARFKIDRARTTTGVVLRFTTTSARVTARFRVLPGENRGSRFGVRQNGVQTAERSFTRNETDISLEMVSVAPGTAVPFEILLPIFSNYGLTGLELSDGALLANPARAGPVYAAIGDSITHGTGQSATWETYPWLLAQTMGWTLHNLAVGGARVSPPVGHDLAGRKIDVVSILIGFNDWNLVNDPAVYRADYGTLLDHVRRHQPGTAILCITPLFSGKTKAPGPGVVTDLEPYRAAVRGLVQARAAAGDQRIFLIEGLPLAGAADLAKDGVHLSVAGAAHVARTLGDAIKKLELAPPAPAPTPL